MDAILIQAMKYFAGEIRNIDSDGPDDESRREDIINDLSTLTHYAVYGSNVLIRTVAGRCMIEKKSLQGSDVISFTYRDHRDTVSEKFLMNASSISKHLGDMLRDNRGKRVDMVALTQD